MRRFYHAVDAGDLDSIAATFAPNVTYERGSRAFRSLGEVRAFYERGRSDTIAGGTHRLDGLEEDGDAVTATGTFDGTYADGSSGVVAFVDRFEFDGDLVVRRRTDFPGREI